VTGGVHNPALVAALRYVATRPGCNLMRVAEHVGRFSGRRVDYDPVHRALDLALVEHRPVRGEPVGNGSYRLHLTPTGWQVLNANDSRTA
jgi:hypothetical protein